VIGKVLRGTRADRLLYYLYGPGKANEHTDPHLVAGFDDPAELEPPRKADGSRDFRRLAGLLAQPLAALYGPGYDKPVWHCAVRAAPGDRILSDAEWGEVAAEIMDRTGLAPRGDDAGVRWVAVRHADDHVHIVATLARQDGARPRIWNDFYRVREACLDVEERFGLRITPPADRTAAKRPTRAETEQATRRGWAEPPRVALRRQVCTAAAGARTEAEFFTALTEAGVLVRRRYSTLRPGEVTGYAVGLPRHTARGGGTVWYGGAKLAADLTLPKLRRRWAGTPADHRLGHGLSAPAARAVLRNAVAGAAERARSEPEFFARLRDGGIRVRLRFSEVHPGQVTGYAVGLPGHDDGLGRPLWHSGGRLSGELTLPQLRHRWTADGSAGAEHPGAAPQHSGPFRFTAPERDAIFEHAAQQAAMAAEHIRRCAEHDPADAADAAWAAADALHTAARATGSRVLRRAADSYDRAARAPYGRIPARTCDGDRLRTAARALALTGTITADTPLIAVALIANLVALAAAVAQLRQSQEHAAQAAAARVAAEHLHAATVRARSRVTSSFDQASAQRRDRPATAADLAQRDFPFAPHPGQPLAAHHGQARPAPGRRPGPPGRTGPRR